MLRRLLEESTRASSSASEASSTILPATPTQALPANPSASLTGPATASSSSSPGSSSTTTTAAAGVVGLGPPVAAAAAADSLQRSTTILLQQHQQQQHPAAALANSTQLYLPDTGNDDLEYSILAAFSDMETVLLACISTLLPLIVALGIAFGIRHVWRKYKGRRCSTESGLPWYRGVCSRDDTVESLHHRPHSASQTIHPPTQILSAQDLVNGMDGSRYLCESEVIEGVTLTSDNVEYASPGSHMSKNANGNIITLTLKNNHLIVETEERADPLEDSRNRKYQDTGCSVIVEAPPNYLGNDSNINKGSSDDVAGRVTDQQALVHREEIAEDRSCEFTNYKLFGSTNTGLSQSDLSIYSQGSVNPSYRYGNQLEYEADHFGYLTQGIDCKTSGNSLRKLDAGSSSKWVEFDKSPDTEKTLLDDSKSPSFEKDVTDNLSASVEQLKSKESLENSGSSLEQQDSTDMSNSEETTVRSNPNLRMNGTTPNKLQVMEQKVLNIDLMIKTNEVNSSTTMKPVITGAILKDETNFQEDAFQEQQRKLGNGTLTPEHQKPDNHEDKNNLIEPKNKEQNSILTRPESSAFVPSHKRTGSIPPRLIEESLEIECKKALDIYSQIKTSTKSILPGLSPKFELLQNEISPVDEKES